MNNLEEISIKPGYPMPRGATFQGDGVQFTIFSRHADNVILVLFENEEPDSPYREIKLDPGKNRTGDIWHVFVRGIGPGQYYGYRVDGPFEPAEGHRFNRDRLLIDPCARALSGNFIWDLKKARSHESGSVDDRESLFHRDNRESAPRSIVTGDLPPTDDRPLNLPIDNTIIYEMHVRGYTMHPTSGAARPGTFSGLTDKIPYLKELGVTAVELLPVQEFDSLENINTNPDTGERLKNYWGYSTLAFFAPRAGYGSGDGIGEQVLEFREMVRAFHEAGIEVILDVVFNHTAEGDEMGPTVSFRGVDNSIYYILADDKREYMNYSGCGNTVNCNHPLVREYILECLRYWVMEMNVDGFRFDLASILGRDTDGTILPNPPLIETIEEDPILRNTKIIAEAWDAAGAYQVGDFPGRWAEWNGRYRDDIRAFWHRLPNMTGALATRLTGSSDLYQRPDRGPRHSINFITCHDGFTMIDLVSYNKKNNRANGENNRDGENHNISYNWGSEGETDDPKINRIRARQVKNFFTTLMVSQGVPMLLGGDEFLRTQKGNNNAYCQDNEISWIDWRLSEKNKEMIRFVKSLIHFRQRHPVFRKEYFFTGKICEENGVPDITWHGCRLDEPDWSGESHFLALLINGSSLCHNGTMKQSDSDIFIALNASLEEKKIEIPSSPSGKNWRLVIRTDNEAPDDIYSPESSPEVMEDTLTIERASALVLATDP